MPPLMYKYKIPVLILFHTLKLLDFIYAKPASFIFDASF